MAISPEYKEILRKLSVRDFVRNNKRAPTTGELNQLIHNIDVKYYDVDTIGISGFDATKPQFREIASVEEENKNREAFFSDMLALNQKLDRLIDIEEAAFRGASSTIARVNKTLDQYVSRLDNLLLLYGKDDIFLSGVEETFASQEYVDRENTTASVEAFNVTLGKRHLEVIDLEKVKLKVTPLSNQAFVSYVANSPVSSLKEDDGNIWKGVVKTTYQLGRVSLLFEVTFPEATDISTMKFSVLPIESNKYMTCTLFYSTNGSSFNPIYPVEQRVTSSLIVPVNSTGVKKLQILLSKEAADNKLENNEYEYLFLIDRISFEAGEFELSDFSTLVAGPYEVVSSDGSEVYFTKATLTACTLEPTGTSVAFYLSNDGETYSAIDHKGLTSSYLTFGDHTPDQAISFVDSDLSAHSLVERLELTEEVDVGHEAYLNAYITSDYAEKIPSRNIRIKRNIVTADSEEVVLGTSPGWVLDKFRGTYSSTIYISNPEGRLLDLGPKGLLLNGQLVTGEQWFKQGFNVIVTDSSNWSAIPVGLTTEAALVAADPLYPYNHRYLFSGYNYPNTFTGDKVYFGCDEYFGLYMNYISPEEFDTISSRDSNAFKVFTVEEVDDKLYFKVKVDKRSSTWSSELFDLDFIVQSAPTNRLWVKAVLSSNEKKLTPLIESFKVRVV